MGNTLLTRHMGLLNEHCTGYKIMNQKRPDLNHDMNRSYVTSRILVPKYKFMSLCWKIYYIHSVFLGWEMSVSNLAFYKSEV